MRVHLPLKTQAIIGIAAAVGIGLIAATALLFPRSQSYGPAEMLPADRTALYLEHTDASVLMRLRSTVPSLDTLPPDAGATAALIRHDDGSRRWVVFARDEAGASAIRADASTLALIGTGARLSDDPAFRALSRDRAGTGSWLFLRDAQHDLSLPPVLAQPHGPLSIELRPDETRVAWTTDGVTRPLTSGFKDIGMPVVLRVQSGDLRRFVATASDALSPDTRLAYKAALRGWFERAFGKDVSLAYDLGPLLEDQASLTLARAQSGTVALLEGRSRGAASRLEALHAAFRATAGGALHVQRTFDEQFRVHNVRAGSETTDDTSVIEGWTVRSTTRENNGIHSALKGDRFILSDDADLLREAIDALPVPAADGPGMIVAHGELDTEDTRSLLQTALPGQEPPLPGALASEPLLRWELIRNGNLAILRVF